MTSKLTAMFTLLSFVTFVGAWWVFRLMNRPVLEPLELMKMSLVILGISYFVGFVLSRLGVQMIQEIIAERRSREETRRLRARELYEQALQPGGEMGGNDESDHAAAES